MCRLAYFRRLKEGSRIYDELEYLLLRLEMSRGGDGNGVGALVIVDNKKFFEIRKGLGYDITHATKDIRRLLKIAINGVMFHTRMAVRIIDSSMNHPFSTENLMLIHNGADAGMEIMTRELKNRGYDIPKNVTDTYIMTQLLDKFYLETNSEEKAVFKLFKILNPVNAVYVQFYNTGNVYFIVKDQDFQIYWDNDMVIAMSEFLDEYYQDIYTCDKCIVKLEPNKKPQTIYGQLYKFQRSLYELPIPEYYYDEELDLDELYDYAGMIWGRDKYL